MDIIAFLLKSCKYTTNNNKKKKIEFMWGYCISFTGRFKKEKHISLMNVFKVAWLRIERAGGHRPLRCYPFECWKERNTVSFMYSLFKYIEFGHQYPFKKKKNVVHVAWVKRDRQNDNKWEKEKKNCLCYYRSCHGNHVEILGIQIAVTPTTASRTLSTSPAPFRNSGSKEHIFYYILLNIFFFFFGLWLDHAV